jgi:hypothetical protein
MNSNKDAIRVMIELSDTWESANKVVEEFAGIQDIPQKLGYIKGMFDVSVVGRTDTGTDRDKYDYIAMLSAIVNKKWRQLVQEGEIIKTAEKVNSLPLDCHLTHAIFACNRLLRDDYKNTEQDFSRLNEALQGACRKKNETAKKAALEDIQRAKQKVRYYIYVEYLNVPADVNRVVKTESQLIISLSCELLEGANGKDGSFIGNSLKKLRWITAHELGHALLHSNSLKPGETQGSIELDGAAENEADIFAKELLRLRNKRNEALRESGVL